MILNILKAIRKGDTIIVSTMPMTIKRNGVNNSTRNLKHIAEVTHDSSNTTLGVPIATIHDVDYVMHEDQRPHTWTLCVPQMEDIQITLGGVSYALGYI